MSDVYIFVNSGRKFFSMKSIMFDVIYTLQEDNRYNSDESEVKHHLERENEPK